VTTRANALLSPRVSNANYSYLTIKIDRRVSAGGLSVYGFLDGQDSVAMTRRLSPSTLAHVDQLVERNRVSKPSRKRGRVRRARVWRSRQGGSPRGYANVSVWVREPRRPHGLRDVPSRKQRLQSQADGTARAIRVGRPRLVGETTPSRKSQRSAHKPASCLCGSVAEPLTEESSRFSAGRMSTPPSRSSRPVEQLIQPYSEPPFVPKTRINCLVTYSPQF
jgi:hypothetical protein